MNIVVFAARAPSIVNLCASDDRAIHPIQKGRVEYLEDGIQSLMKDRDLVHRDVKFTI